MSLQCPRCHSPEIASLRTAMKITAAIGAVGGAARGVSSACWCRRRIDLRADARLTQLQSAEIQHRKWFARNQTGSVASRYLGQISIGANRDDS
jgi:hypothetical protein